MLQTSIPFAITVVLIAVGYIFKRLKIFNESDGKTISRILISFTLPCLILSKVPIIKISWELFLLMGMGVFCGAILQIAAVFITRGKPDAERGLYALNMSGYNIGLLAYPIANMLWGDYGLSYLIMFDLGNGLALFGINYVIAKRYAQGKIPHPVEILKMLGKSFAFMSYWILLLLSALKVTYPPFVVKLLDTISGGNTVLSLLLLGITLSFTFSKDKLKAMLQILGVRYAFGVLAALAIFFLTPFSTVQKMALVMAVLLPISVSATSYSIELGFDSNLSAALNNLSIIISLTVIWILLGIIFPLAGVVA